MGNNLAPLRLGSPVRFRDRWEGHLWAFEVDEGWQVINLVVRRGILWSSSVKLPFAAASEWSGDHVALGCNSDEAFRRQVAPVAAQGHILSSRTPLTTAGVRLTGALVEAAQRRVRHLLIRHGMAAPKERKAGVEQVSFEEGRVVLEVQLERLPIYRSDEDLHLLVRDVLARHPYLTADDRRRVAVQVSDGTVRLVGNVRTTQARDWAAEAAASVDGTEGVRNEIVDDIRLEMAAAQALDRAGLFRTALVYPRSSLGDISLFGYAPSAGAIEEIVRVVSRVPGVRSVTGRLEVRV